MNRFRHWLKRFIRRSIPVMAQKQGRRVRLRDVAERAGVSLGSASQAFGRPELVSERVRERVMAAAKDLGYAGPDPAARHLRIGRTGVLGLIFAERLGYQFTDSAAPAFLRGVARGMRKAPLGLLLLPDSRFREEVARTVRDAAVDGSSSTRCLGTILASRQPSGGICRS